MHYSRTTREDQSCLCRACLKILETKAGPTAELVSKGLHHTDLALGEQTTIGHSQNRDTLGVQTTIPCRDIGLPKDYPSEQESPPKNDLPVAG